MDRLGSVSVDFGSPTPISVKGKTSIHTGMALRIALDKDSLEGSQYFLIPAAQTQPYQFDAGSNGMTIWVQLDVVALAAETIYYWTQQGD